MEILDVKNRAEFREWLINNSKLCKECFVEVSRGKPSSNGLSYLDAVEEALCFGWIDSTLRNIDGKSIQRFSPRGKNSPWTELNKERVRRLIKLGLMTDEGLKVLPDLDKKFVIPAFYIDILKENGIYEVFSDFPPLYQRIRIYNLEFTRGRSDFEFKKSLENFIKNTKDNKMYGNWNDYGRLLDY